jgi:hypothetical protein
MKVGKWMPSSTMLPSSGAIVPLYREKGPSDFIILRTQSRPCRKTATTQAAQNVTEKVDLFKGLTHWAGWCGKDWWLLLSKGVEQQRLWQQRELQIGYNSTNQPGRYK